MVVYAIIAYRASKSLCFRSLLPFSINTPFATVRGWSQEQAVEQA